MVSPFSKSYDLSAIFISINTFESIEIDRLITRKQEYTGRFQ